MPWLGAPSVSDRLWRRAAIGHTACNIRRMAASGEGPPSRRGTRNLHPLYLGQPAWNFINALFFEYGIAAYDLEIGKVMNGRKDKARFKHEAKSVLRARFASRPPRTT